MRNWLKFRDDLPPDAAETHIVAPRPQPAMGGAYGSLYKYLLNRYADTTVLTFAQIEDLLGYTLPDLARLRPDWWTSTDPPAPSQHSDAWRLANRKATPNLAAQTVSFERVP